MPEIIVERMAGDKETMFSVGARLPILLGQWRAVSEILYEFDSHEFGGIEDVDIAEVENSLKDSPDTFKVNYYGADVGSIVEYYGKNAAVWYAKQDMEDAAHRLRGLRLRIEKMSKEEYAVFAALDKRDFVASLDITPRHFLAQEPDPVSHFTEIVHCIKVGELPDGKMPVSAGILVLRLDLDDLIEDETTDANIKEWAEKLLHQGISTVIVDI